MHKRCKSSLLFNLTQNFKVVRLLIIKHSFVVCTHYLHGFKSCPVIHRRFVNVFLAWMDYAVFQYQHHVPGEIVQLGTLEDAVSDYFVVQNF